MNPFRRVLALFTLSATLLLTACGGGDSADSSSDADEPAAAAADATPMGSASVTGSISFSGTAPDPVPVRLDRECNELQAGDTVYAQNVVVNDNGTLKNVFVYVKEGLPDGYNFPAPTEPVVFDQTGCMYTPHVFGVQAGQPIKILNSDPLLHNIHAMPETNRPFNFGMPRQGDEREREFRVPEVPVFIKCDVHPWMGAYAGVTDHPFYSVSGDDGGFSIEGLPAGDYVIEAWHEEYGTQTQNVSVTDGAAASVSFEFSSAS
ncbi:MAG: carboxypeptidase regulatory-like domain-containing protein [Rhodothermales bacterium]|nr:carboxypeptidase regulatory-like domain-containing protein [Rhodothermales bacterium]MBO6778124.1 carboxypeptidase regulatory-like domain-containing protein [Rhodothermales bacterium]